MSTATLNGRPRKQLSHQLDRLDGILDALADALPGAVADACRDGARLAVREAAAELLTNPDFLARLAAMTTPPPPPVAAATNVPSPSATRPSIRERVMARLAGMAAVTDRVRAVSAAVVTRVRAASLAVANRVRAASVAVVTRFTTVTIAVRLLSHALPVRRIIAVAGGVGVATATVCYLCPPGLTAAVAGVGAAVAAAAVQVGAWVRRSVGTLRLGG